MALAKGKILQVGDSTATSESLNCKLKLNTTTEKFTDPNQFVEFYTCKIIKTRHWESVQGQEANAG